MVLRRASIPLAQDNCPLKHYQKLRIARKDAVPKRLNLGDLHDTAHDSEQAPRGFLDYGKKTAQALVSTITGE